jgi:hypothetical protein
MYYNEQVPEKKVWLKMMGLGPGPKLFFGIFLVNTGV